MNTKLYRFFVAVVFVLLFYGTYQAAVVAPTEETMGDAQRIFYYHVPAATAAYTLFFVNFVASILYLWKRSPKADAWALTSAEVGLVFATVVLATGPIWARYAWGKWWTWEMRLTTFLILWLLYVSYLALRRSSEGGSTPVLASALAILAFAGVIAWFRYEVARVEQALNAAHIKKAALSSAAFMALPAMFLFQAPHRSNPRDYMYAAYIVAWVIYVAYILLLTIKVGKLKKEAAELGL